MKIKISYVFIVLLGLVSICLLYQKEDINDVELGNLSSEIVLLSDTLILEDFPNEATEPTNLRTSIEDQIELLKENMIVMTALKDNFNNDYSSISQRDKIFIKISLAEVSKYRELYQDTLGSIYNILIPYDGLYDTLSENDIQLIGSQIKDIQTYRLVLLEKTNEEIQTIINLLDKY